MYDGVRTGFEVSSNMRSLTIGVADTWYPHTPGLPSSSTRRVAFPMESTMMIRGAICPSNKISECGTCWNT